MLKKAFSFDGRIRRTEFGISYLIYTACTAPFKIYFKIELEPSVTMSLLYFVILIPALWFLFAQGSKRCHDRGNSGWYQLIPFYIFWLIFADGDIGENQFGPNPKNIGNGNSINEIVAKEI